MRPARFDFASAKDDTAVAIGEIEHALATLHAAQKPTADVREWRENVIDAIDALRGALAALTDVRNR